MNQAKRTRRQMDQVIFTSLLALCLNYGYLASGAEASDCDEFDIDIDAACSNMGTNYDPSCDTSYMSSSSSSYYPTSNYSSSSGYSSGSGYSNTCSSTNANYGSNYGSNYNSNYGSNPYKSKNQRNSSGSYYGNGSYSNNNNVGRYSDYSSYDKIYNSGYGLNSSPNGLVSSTRTPLIQGAPNTAAQTMVTPGQGPAIGDGQTPTGVTSGMSNYQNDYPASHITGLPDVPGSIEGKQMINAAVQPYLRPPTQNNGQDPGSIDNPPNFYQPPATVTKINPQGGITGTAPTERWGGQTTKDYGINAKCKKETHTINDFGQKLTEKPDLYATPQCAQDGPRLEFGAKDNTSLHRASNRTGAHATTDRQGNRTFFRGPNLRSQATLANY